MEPLINQRGASGSDAHRERDICASGNGLALCSGDMLLEALVACAGVTLRAVATALDIPLRGGTVTAEGDLDFRGTLGVNKETPVGFKDIRLHFHVDTDASAEQLESLLKLTKRYCVIYQTLQQSPGMSCTMQGKMIIGS